MRYVILHHTGCPTPHFDLMLERDTDGPLQSWRLPNWPLSLGDVFTPIAPHRRAYLDLEGTLSGDRGRVDRVASGRYDYLPSERGSLCIRLMPLNILLCLPLEPSLPERERE